MQYSYIFKGIATYIAAICCNFPRSNILNALRGSTRPVAAPVLLIQFANFAPMHFHSGLACIFIK